MPTKAMVIDLLRQGQIDEEEFVAALSQTEGQVELAMRMQEEGFAHLLELDQAPAWRGGNLYNLACQFALIMQSATPVTNVVRRTIIDMALRRQRPGSGSSVAFLTERTTLLTWPDLSTVLTAVP